MGRVVYNTFEFESGKMIFDLLILPHHQHWLTIPRYLESI